MAVDSFTERLARVRERFVLALESKIEDTLAAVPRLAGDDPAAAFAAVEESYRRIHGIVGVGLTVGFAGTGHAARVVENILLGPRQAERGLTGREMVSFKQALHALREAAARELQSFHSGSQPLTRTSATGHECSDSEVRIVLRHPRVRTSESKEH